MDYSMLVFFVGIAIILYILSRFLSGWVRLGLGWIAGGVLIVIGYQIANGMEITRTTVIDVGISEITTLNLGISAENTFIILTLIGIIMIFSSSGDWI